MRRGYWTAIAFGVLVGPAVGQGHDLGPTTFLSGSGSASGDGLTAYQQVGCALPAKVSGGGHGVHGGLATTIIGAARLELLEAPASNPAGHLATVTARSSAPWFAGPPGGTLYYRPGGGSTVTPVLMFSAGDSLGALIPGAAFGDRGLEFYLSARVGSLTLTVPRGDPLANPLRIASELTNYTAGGELATVKETYRMISFGAEVNPASIASVLEDDLGGANKEVWRFGRWNPELGSSGACARRLQRSVASASLDGPRHLGFRNHSQARLESDRESVRVSRRSEFDRGRLGQRLLHVRGGGRCRSSGSESPARLRRRERNVSECVSLRVLDGVLRKQCRPGGARHDLDDSE